MATEHVIMVGFLLVSLIGFCIGLYISERWKWHNIKNDFWDTKVGDGIRGAIIANIILLVGVGFILLFGFAMQLE